MCQDFPEHRSELPRTRQTVSQRVARRAPRDARVGLYLACMAVWVAGGCRPGDQTGGQVERFVRGDTAVTVSHIADDEAPQLELQRQWTVGEAAGNDSTLQFGRLQHAAILPDDAIAVYDASFGSVRVFSATGAYRRSVGRKGAGPGEYDGVAGMVALKDGRLIVRDKSRLVTFDSGGRPFTVANVGPPPFGAPSLVKDVNDGVYLQVTTAMERMNDGVHIRTGYVRHSDGGMGSDTIRPPSLENDTPSATPFAPAVLHVWHPGGGYTSVRNTEYRIAIPSSNGSPVRFERTAPAPVPLVEGERAEQQEFFDALHRRNPTSPRLVVPGTKPLIRRLFVDDGGRVWVQRHVVAEPTGAEPDTTKSPFERERVWAEPAVWDLVAPDGTLLGTLRIPPGTTVLAARGESVWGVARDADDVQYLARWRLIEGNRPDQAAW